jgi:hypothetical protein
VYKGMLRSAVVGAFFKDLQNAAYETAFAIYHRRFSTNTTPKWPLAQPMRFLGHNGEINTLQVGRGGARAGGRARASGALPPGRPHGSCAAGPLRRLQARRGGCRPAAEACRALPARACWPLTYPAPRTPPLSAPLRATSTGWPLASTS